MFALTINYCNEEFHVHTVSENAITLMDLAQTIADEMAEDIELTSIPLSWQRNRDGNWQGFLEDADTTFTIETVKVS